jgi:hypothetical protein
MLRGDRNYSAVMLLAKQFSTEKLVWRAVVCQPDLHQPQFRPRTPSDALPAALLA